MKKSIPERNILYSWIIMGVGALIAVVGRTNLWVWIGLAVIVVGIIYHLVTVRCPYCGFMLAGYRPVPKVCPQCHKAFEE